MIQILPVNNKIIIKEVELKEKMQGGIFIPASVQEKPYEGIVYKSACPDYKPGEVILYQKFAGFNFKNENESFLVIEPEDVLVKLLKVDEKENSESKELSND